MARPHKTGIDYFPVDVDMADSTEVAYLEAKHGLVAYGLILRLYSRIYREGYFIEWDEVEQYVFARSVGMEKEAVAAIVEDALEVGLFDRGLLEKQGILTSEGVQKRFVSIAGNRRSFTPIPRSHRVMDAHNHGEGGVIEGQSTQSKGKESKEENKDIVRRAVEHLNEKAGTSFKTSSQRTAGFINARINEGFTLDDILTVIDIKTAEWLKDPRMARFLRPETLFSAKFEGYLNERRKEVVNREPDRMRDALTMGEDRG